MESSAIKLLCSLLWTLLLSFTLNVSNSCVHSFKKETSLYERAEFHFTELKRTLEKIRVSQSQHVHKRDTSRKDRIVNSLANLCSQLSSDLKNEHTTTARTSTTTALIDSFVSEDELSKWRKPELFVKGVTVESDGDRANVTFNVSHSSQAFVTRLESLDFYSTLIGEPGRYDRPVTSQVNLSVEASAMRCTGQFEDSYFLMFGLHQDSRYTTQARLDICPFLCIGDDIIEDDKNESKTITEKMTSQVFRLPQFRLVSDPGDEILIQAGEDPYLDIDLIFGDFFSMDVRVTLWDWESQRFITEGIDLTPPDYYYENPTPALLSIDYLGEIAVNGTDDTATRSGKVQNVISRLRINIKIGSRKMSGKLLLMYTTESTWTKRRIVDWVRGERTILLKLPYKITALPRNQNEEIIAGLSECNSKELEKRNRTCTIDCYADGTDIDSIFILKNSPYQPPIKAVSYVIHGQTAYSKNDLGDPTPDKEGMYQCIVIFKDGHMETENISLATTGFTQIDSILVQDLDNGTLQVVCSASGHQPLSVRMTTFEINETTEKTRSLVTVGNSTRLTLSFSKDELLLFPKASFDCAADGERGYAQERVHLSDFVGN